MFTERQSIAIAFWMDVILLVLSGVLYKLHPPTGRFTFTIFALWTLVIALWKGTWFIRVLAVIGVLLYYPAGWLLHGPEAQRYALICGGALMAIVSVQLLTKQFKERAKEYTEAMKKQ